MRDETLRGYGSSDPDDLAVVTCASLRVSGHEPMVDFECNHQGAVVAIVVYRRGIAAARVRVARFDVGGMRATSMQLSTLAASILAASRIAVQPARGGVPAPEDKPE